MIIQTNNQNQFNQKAWRIRTQVSTILTKWGLLPRFTRWRLTQDPGTGMVVLFGVLNNSYIAAHSSIPFSDYFDPRVLHDLADELQVQVVSCNSDGLRYAFILNRGELGKLPTHIDFPFSDDGKLLVRVAYSDESQSAPTQPIGLTTVDDHSLVRQGVGAFLKVFDDIQLRDNAASQLSAQEMPAIAVIDEAEFNKRVAEQQANRQTKINLGRLPTK